MVRAFEILLRIYPRSQRELFEQEMLGVFREASEEYREREWSDCLRFLLRESAGVMRGAGIEWVNTWRAAGAGFLDTGVAVWGGVFVAALGHMVLYATLLH